MPMPQANAPIAMMDIAMGIFVSSLCFIVNLNIFMSTITMRRGMALGTPGRGSTPESLWYD
jgi:hypothetical protein